MKEKIIEICKQIEKEKKIKILFCVESGSRSWGLESKDSDYDVRFVFVRPINDYVTINKPEEVMSSSYDKDGNIISQKRCMIDVCGFDIFKFVKMLSSSNPTTIEWLRSNIIYLGKQNQVFVDYAKNDFNPISLYWHYKSMCRQNYLKYLKFGNVVTYKKYLYAMRGLVNAKWIAYSKLLPQINFNKQIDESEEFELLPINIIKELRKIISLKKNSKEKNIIKNIVKIDNYIESFLKDDGDVPEKKKMVTDNILDNELKRIVLK